MNLAIPILMYHAIAEHPAAATRGLSVRPEMFAAQLALLQQQGFTPLTFSDLCAALRNAAAAKAAAGAENTGTETTGAQTTGVALGADILPTRPIVLTFDDGYADFHREALPLLTQYGYPATLFITTGWLADAGEYAAGTPLDRMLTWRQAEEVAAAGIEIGAHSHSHAQLDQLPRAALLAELSTSKQLLEDRLGQEVPNLAYPYGYSSVRVRDAVHGAGYQHAAAVSNAIARPATDLLALPRLTIRRSTSLDTFRRIINKQGIPRIFCIDRALTAGWSLVRRSRYAVLRARGLD